ncbi:MAG: hypothetical protein LIR46_11520 [Bacteroidota bacterium]|nr:hypothetical protein [Bacteroidota bacterium]
MAKTGFWLNGARGKFAGAVLQKNAYGSTTMREKVNPKNPQTQKQMYQRAIMATVMAAYAAGKEIFNHSFEGITPGAKSQALFMSENAKLLRAQMIEDINDVYVTVPGISTPVPNAYVISKGSMPETSFNELRLIYDSEQPITVKDLAAANGLVKDDLYTIVGVVQDGNTLYKVDGHDEYSAQLRGGSFFFIRLKVKDTESIEVAAKLNQLFEVDAYSLPAGKQPKSLDIAISNAYDIEDFAALTDAGMYGVIRSREDSGLRSSSSMYLYITSSSDCGLNAKWLKEAWLPGSKTSLGDPSKILNGAESNPINAFSIRSAYAMIGGNEVTLDLMQPLRTISNTPTRIAIQGSNVNLANITLKIDSAEPVQPTYNDRNTVATFVTSGSHTNYQLMTNGNNWIKLEVEGE